MLKLKSFLKITSLCLFVFVLFIPNVFSATLRVPSQYSTIQSAIDAASSGDTVLVTAGTYTEAITLTNGVILQSVSGSASTFLDGTGLDASVVTMASNSTLDGFTIQNGTGTTTAPLGGDLQGGGGIFCNSKTNVTIQNCIITNNSVSLISANDAYGGGMYVQNTTSSTISNCTFSSNTSAYQTGGLVFLALSGNTTSFTITDCIFDSNEAIDNVGGMNTAGTGGSYNITVSRCTFLNNISSGDSGGAELGDGTFTVNNCLFYSNSAADAAGGLVISTTTGDCTATVTNCTFANNTGNGSHGASAFHGGGTTATATFRNCIFYGNSGYGIYENHTDGDAIPINCLFFNNTSGLFYDEDEAASFTLAQINALSGASGNISSDPMFINTDNNNYHLESTTIGYTVDSPCVDAGTSTGAPTTDLDGATRPQGVTYDIGVYEAAGSGSRIATLTKNANKDKAAVGQIITYTLSIANTSNQSMIDTHIYDTLPKGFKYLTGSAKLNNVSITEPEGARTRDFNLGTLASNATYTLKYKTVVGSGVNYGKAKNIAHLQNSTGSELSTVAEETVLIVPNPIFNTATIIGKVFRDNNKNGYQDEGEVGLPYISLITEDGFLATTDKYGRYHIEGLKPQTKIVAVMTNTLPSGATLTTENPVLLRFSVALTMKANFGVYIEENQK